MSVAADTTPTTRLTLEESMQRRLALLEECNTDPQLRSLLLAHYKYNVVDWCNDFVWTYDPRRQPSNIPFDLYPKQEEFLNWITDRYELKEDCIAEKSRDTGFTWLCVLWATHRMLFYSGFKATFGSRKAGLVDTLGDPDSIFEKVRMLIRGLPWWMRPKRLADNKLKITNKDNGSTLTGEGGDNMGRGGRSSIYFKDESAFIERPEKVDAAVSNNSDCKVDISTPNGPGNPFYRKRMSKLFPVFTCHWLDDERKNIWELRDEHGAIVATGHGRNAPEGAKYPWYEKMKRSLDKVILAQEVDLDYMASIEGVCIPHEWVMAAVDLCDRLNLPRNGRPKAGLDVADGGKDKSVLTSRRGCVVENIESRSEGNTNSTAYWARDLCYSWGVDLLNYDGIGIGAGVGGTLALDPNLRIRVQKVVGSGDTTDTVWECFDYRTSGELFHNLRAELWWMVRRRFEKTYEFTTGEAIYPLDELISIPNHPDLIVQLSSPLRKYTDSGKTLIESKEDMAKRSIESPDFADSLVYAFAPDYAPVFGVSNSASYSY